MDEIQQIKWVLGSEAFWADDTCDAFGMNGPAALTVRITEDASGRRWQVEQNGHVRMASDKSFPSVKETKADARRVLQERLSELSYAAEPPARIDM